jgi:16S rRNA (guanine(1405)-N(7))-methyltransferase
MTEKLDELIEAVQDGAKYRQIHIPLVRQIAAQELNKERSWKETVKAVRNKLHQVGGAYQPQTIHYELLAEKLENLPKDLLSPEVQDFCRETMLLHTSTRERLPILEKFFEQSLAGFTPVNSLLDVACGLNPLAIAWMPLAQNVRFLACDIYMDQIEFLNAFFAHFGINGQAFLCDLTSEIPQDTVEVALVLKTIPCLEQIDKHIGLRLLTELQAQHLLVSFPAQSLSGKNKGMRDFYDQHFQQLIAEAGWQVQPYSFTTEEAYLIHK